MNVIIYTDCFLGHLSLLRTICQMQGIEVHIIENAADICAYCAAHHEPTLFFVASEDARVCRAVSASSNDYVVLVTTSREAEKRESLPFCLAVLRTDSVAFPELARQAVTYAVRLARPYQLKLWNSRKKITVEVRDVQWAEYKANEQLLLFHMGNGTCIKAAGCLPFFESRLRRAGFYTCATGVMVNLVAVECPEPVPAKKLLLKGRRRCRYADRHFAMAIRAAFKSGYMSLL